MTRPARIAFIVFSIATAAIAAKYSVGDHVQVTAFKQTVPGVVTRVYRDTLYTIRYDAGYGDYVTLLEYIHPMSGSRWSHPPAVGDRVMVPYGQSAYAASVIAERLGDAYRVRYADGSEWDTVGDYMRPSTAAKPPAPTKPPPAAKPPAAAAAGPAPVDFAFLGLDPQHSVIRYRIKVHSPKPVTEVQIAARYLAADGKVVNDTTLVWQNIVKSKRQPIENGKTYEDTSYLFPNTARVETKLKMVVFSDGTRWSAGG